MKVIMQRVNIKLWDILGCFHYILKAPRMFLKGYSLEAKIYALKFCVLIVLPKFIVSYEKILNYAKKIT